MMKASLVDTHTHLYYKSGSGELAAQMDRCIENGVDRMILPNVDVSSVPLVFKTVSDYPQNCFAMLGLHPCSVKEDFELSLQQIEAELSTRHIVAIGEIGLDLYWDKNMRTEQEIALKTQLNWAKDLQLPVSIHCRNAFAEIIPILKDEQDGRLSGVLHCFTGTLEEAKILIDYGFHLGIGGVVTFKKAGLDEIIKTLSLTQIVLETDSPYLAPSPYRGKENESSYLRIIAEKVADIYEVSLEEVARITTQNAERIFKLHPLHAT